MKSLDQHQMLRALALAKKGLGFTYTNPMVGALIVDQNGLIVGQGYHEKFGQAHAEIHALTQAGSKAQGATLYVTLEPCSHYGKTPPCVDAIIQSKIKKVVIATKDPNPKVCGQGIAKLTENKINVVLGIEKEMAQKLNRVFFHRFTKNTPYIVCKAAMDQNQCMGYQTQRVQISSKASRSLTMKLRAWMNAVMVGKNTWKTDNPTLSLTGRYQDVPFYRILLDPKLEISPQAAIFSTPQPIVLICDQQIKTPKHAFGKNVEILRLACQDGRFDIHALTQTLWAHGITSILLEGGPDLIGQYAKANLIAEYFLLKAPVALKKRQDAVFFPENVSMTVQKEVFLGGDTVVHATGNL